MAASIIPQIGVKAGLILSYILWGLFFLIVTVIVSAAVIALLIKKKSTKFVELNLVSKKIQTFSGKYKKKRGGLKLLWISKLKKYLPNVQQEAIYNEKGKDVVILLKDNNGFHHTARLPSYKELKLWYKVIYEIDIDEKVTKTIKEEGKADKKVFYYKFEKERKNFETIFLLPSPSEDLDWLGTQCSEADMEFVDSWWKHPSTMLIATTAICGFIFIISLIITAKMT